MAGASNPSDVELDEILRAELDAINQRRKALGREAVTAGSSAPPSPVLDVVGLTLSGGGIRSASFSLGVLQALNEANALRKIDYLSTVSGGGYIGSALSATMTTNGGKFAFGQSTGPRSVDASLTDVMDTPAVGHLRNYSNYLMPFGLRDLVTAIAIVLRGLVTNVTLVLPVILLLAAVTIYSSPDRSDLLEPNILGIPLVWLKVTHFGVTILVTLFAFPLFMLWAIYRSHCAAHKQSEFRTWIPVFASAYLIVIAAFFFCELQPFLIAGMFDLADEAGKAHGHDRSLLTAFITRLAAIATPIAAIVTFFRQQVGTLLKSVTSASGMSRKLAAFAAHGAIWFAGAALPLLIWVGYLHLCYWGIINNIPPSQDSVEQSAIHGTIRLEGPGINLRGAVDCRPSAESSCGQASSKPAPLPFGEFYDGTHTPGWLINTAATVSGWLTPLVPAGEFRDWLKIRPVTVLYVIVGLLLMAFSWLMRPNGNSLHRLYRDRLSKAFLFNPDRLARERHHASEQTVDQGRDFETLDTIKISALAPEIPTAPYHLINAALNVQGSDYANRRGRNADFFLFSPRYVGSEATGYAPTTVMEEKTALDLPTAMAISGAAFSSNMGSSSIRALTPTLALLNVRTGYWLCNPRFLGPNAANMDKPRASKWYLWSEISGRLYEDSAEVYITDGGHIENLGMYELLRRRARVIVVVDAEADPAMRLPSFMTLQRYARIDLGVRINMPWDGIRKATLKWMGFSGTCGACPSEAKSSAPADAAASNSPLRTDSGDSGPLASHGPHAAIGTIDYAGGETGWLLYIKSSLSGDENDYVRDYARRNGEFPHESTGDQFFSEEQFEVYRALGFHIVSRLLGGDDKLQVVGVPEPVTMMSDDPNVRTVREALLG